jgi:hypothetical protein
VEPDLLSAITLQTTEAEMTEATHGQFAIGDIVRVKEETYHGQPVGKLAEVLSTNEIGWVRVMYSRQSIETLPPHFLSLVCRGVQLVDAVELEMALKRVCACQNLIVSMEKTAEWMRIRIHDLETGLKLIGNEEVNKQRETNERLTNELEAAQKRIAELESQLKVARDFMLND